MQNLIDALKLDADLREEFLFNPEEVAARYGHQLTARQRELLTYAQQFERDPLLSVTMCGKSSGYEDIAPSKATPK